MTEMKSEKILHHCLNLNTTLTHHTNTSSRPASQNKALLAPEAESRGERDEDETGGMRERMYLDPIHRVMDNSGLRFLQREIKRRKPENKEKQNEMEVRDGRNKTRRSC